MVEKVLMRMKKMLKLFHIHVAFTEINGRFEFRFRMPAKNFQDFGYNYSNITELMHANVNKGKKNGFLCVYVWSAILCINIYT